MLADAVHRVGDPHEMLDELVGDLFVHRVVFGENEGDLQHVLAVKRHPGRPVRLLQRAARGELGTPVEDADVVETEKAPGEHVAPGGVLAVDPPAEVQHQPLKRPLQEPQVRPAEGPLHLVEEERGPGVHRGIHIAEVPLVGGNLPIGVGIEAAQHQQELLLGEIKVHQRQGRSCERPGPRPHTRGTPTCPASRSHRRSACETIPCSARRGQRIP